MLARSTTLHFPNGDSIKTPILVPSFSSKGWKFKRVSNGDEVSEISEAVEWTTEFLVNAVLFSAYDIYYNHYPGPNILGEITDITFIDSGGYELSEDHDLSSVYRMPWPTKDWNISFLNKVLSNLPEEHNIVIINYDDVNEPRLIKDQVKIANQFFSKFPHFLNDILIKIETNTQDYISLKSVLDIIPLLRKFNIVAFTEKELGNSLLDRMVKIAKIRLALDSHGINSPIHVFGSLDPITSCLYFISGAEIFDGLTWLRYAYKDGIAVYQENYRFLKQDLTEKAASTIKFILHDNLLIINRLRDEMILFSRDADFSHFSHHEVQFKDAFPLYDPEVHKNFSGSFWIRRKVMT